MIEVKKLNSKALNDPSWIRYQAIAEALKVARNPSFLVVVRRGELVASTYEVTQFENFWVAKKFLYNEKESSAYLIVVG